MSVYWNDVINFWSKMTIKRLWNASKVYASFQLSRLLKKPIQWGLPFSVSIEPTTACNLRCPECPSGLRAFTRDTGNLKEDFFRHFIAELGGHLFYLTFYFQGEPYINPRFLDMVKYASDRGIYTSTSTNAHFLDDEKAKQTIESGLDRLIISIDGSTQEVYEAYRKSGQLEKVLEGTRNIVKWKKKLNSKTPHIIFQFLVVRPNEHQIEDVRKLAEEYGVDELKLKTAQIYDYKNGNPLIPSIEQYARYKKQADGTYRIKHKLLNQCWKLWHSCVITWDGWIVPCCFDKDATYKLGNLSHENMIDIWQNDAYNGFRKQILKGRQEIDICTNCTEGCSVWKD